MFIFPSQALLFHFLAFAPTFTAVFYAHYQSIFTFQSMPTILLALFHLRIKYILLPVAKLQIPIFSLLRSSSAEFTSLLKSAHG